MPGGTFALEQLLSQRLSKQYKAASHRLLPATRATLLWTSTIVILLFLHLVVGANYLCALGPTTPAPITLGNSWLPMLYNIMIPPTTTAVKNIPNPANNTNSALTSFF